MRKTSFFLIIILAAVLPFMQGCDVETSDNGDLDGLWHLTQVDTAGGGSLDIRSEKRFWAFQNRLMQMSDTELSEYFICRFKRSGDSLFLSEPRYNDRNRADTAVADVSPLRKYGMNSMSESFFIEYLSSRRMRLSSDWLTLYFRKM